MIDGIPSQDQFASILRAALKRAGDTREYIYEPNEFCLRKDDGRTSLHNMYQTFCNESPGNREKLLERFVGAFAEFDQSMPSDFSSARARLMPMVRRVNETSLYSLESGRPRQFIDRSLGVNVVASAVLDSPNSIARLPAHYLDRWSVTAEDVWQSAMSNLQLRSAYSFEPLVDGLYQSTWADDFDATRILLPDLIGQVPVRGTPLVMIPEKNVLLVAGSDDARAIENLVRAGLAVYDMTAYQLVPDVIAIGRDGLRTVRVAQPFQEEIDNRYREAQIRDYTLQKTYLDSAPSDIAFIASLVGFEKDGAFRTIATWSSAESLLPEADVISFVLGEPNALFVRWQDAVSVVGPLTSDPDLMPRRFRVRGLPSAEQIAQLRTLRLSI